MHHLMALFLTETLVTIIAAVALVHGVVPGALWTFQIPFHGPLCRDFVSAHTSMTFLFASKRDAQSFTNIL